MFNKILIKIINVKKGGDKVPKYDDFQLDVQKQNQDKVDEELAITRVSIIINSICLCDI